MWFSLAILSAFFNSLGNVARRTHGSLAQPAELSWWTIIFSLPLTLGLVFMTHGSLWTGTAFILPVVIAAVFTTFASIMLFRAYKYGDASAVCPIANFLPVVMVPLSFLVSGTVPTPLGLLGIMIAAGGVYYSSVSARHDLVHPLRQIWQNRGSRAMLTWVVLVAVSTAFSQVAIETAAPAFVMLLQQLISFALISVYLLCKPMKAWARARRGEQVIRKWGWHIAAIAVFSTLAVYFQYHAMELVDASYVLAVKRLDVLFTVLLAGFFLREKHILKRFKGSIIAIVGVVIIILSA